MANPAAGTDIDAMYAAVVAAPDDEAARRVLADRLLEVGDPQGEFIQLACDAEALSEWDPRRAEIIARAEELRSQHHLAFSRRLRAVKPFNDCSFAGHFAFHRGFPDAIHAHDSRVIDFLPEAAKVSPLRSLHLDNATPDAVRKLSRLPELARLRVLHLRADWSRFNGALLDLFASPHLERLDFLFLSGDLRPRDIEAMARCRALDRLSELHLFGHGKTQTPVDAVLRSPLYASLRTLVLYGVPVAPETLVGLPALRRLELYGVRLGAEGAAAFARRAPGLVSLRLSRCDVGNAEDLAALLRSPALAALESLELSEMVPGRGVRALLDAIELPELRSLALEGPYADGCGEGAGVALESAWTKFARLRALSLKLARIKDEGARALAAAVFPHLESLNLEANDIGHEGMAALSRAPLLTSVRKLSIRGNRCGSEALAGAPLENLRKLELFANNLGVNGVHALLAATPNLEELHAADTDYGAAPSQFIAASKDMHRLRVLHLAESDDLGALARSPAVRTLASLRVSTPRLDAETAYALAALSNLEELTIATPSLSDLALLLLRRRFGPILRTLDAREEWDLQRQPDMHPEWDRYPGPP
jgi:uncharacterized protein (TIGR02996 family)